MTIVSFILFIILIGLLISTHEFGHYIVAKANNIRVVEFMIGVGPVILSFTSGGTKYSLRLLPFGGACVMDGMDDIKLPGEDDEEKRQGVTDEKKESPDRNLEVTENRQGECLISDSENRMNDMETELADGHIRFTEAGIWARISTVLAGPLFSFLFALLLAIILVGSTVEDLPVIQNVMEGYPAAEAGLRSGDVISRIDGEAIHLARQISVITELRNGETLEVEYERDGEKATVVLVPKYDEEMKRYLLGLNGYANYQQITGLKVLEYAAYEVEYGAGIVVKSLKKLISGHGSKDDLAGPVGMAQMVGEVTKESLPYGIKAIIINMMNLAMLLSVNLGVLNLLPVPALDGGKLLFLFFELVRGKKVSPEKEGIVHLIGFAILFCLMIFVLFNDIARLFR